MVLCTGLPRSGKSTWAKTTGYPICSPDAIRLALHGQPFIKEAEPMIWLLARYMVESLFLAGHDTVILDATNTIKRNRDQWLSPKWTVKYYCVDTAPAECIRRAIANKQEYLVPVIERMHKQMEWPPSEHFYTRS